MVVAFLGIERGNWWLAATGALFAGASRPTGLIVGLAVVVAYLLDWIRTGHRLRWDVLALVLTPLGVVAFFVYCWLHFGDPFAYMKASEFGWHGHFQLRCDQRRRPYTSPSTTVAANWSEFSYSYLRLADTGISGPLLSNLSPAWDSYLVYSALSCIAPSSNFRKSGQAGGI